jgi:hypothetical protein
MTTADYKVERAANKLQAFANRLASEGGLKSKLAEPLAEDADLLRKMKPSLIKARAKGETPATPASPSGPQLKPQPRSKQKRSSGGGPNPWLVVGVALAAGIFVAKWIDWRGHAHPRD